MPRKRASIRYPGFFTWPDLPVTAPVESSTSRPWWHSGIAWLDNLPWWIRVVPDVARGADDLWSRRTGRALSDVDRREIRENLVGFFETLTAWSARRGSKGSGS
jgi:hypothetical protein